MKKHAVDTLIAALRDLDPAPETALTESERQRADDTFVRVIATPSDVPPRTDPTPRRRWRLLMPIGLTGAAGAIATALLFGGSAFASWTATPEPLTSAETSAAATTCRANFGISEGGKATVIAERRGKWTYVLISEPKAEVSCLMRNDVVGKNPSGQLFGSSGTPVKPPIVAHDRMVETGSMQGSTDEGWLRDDKELTWTYGYVGSDVTGVTVHTPLGFDVEASVEKGRFAAWWPSDPPSSKNLEVMGPWSYTVTLADGTTRASG